MLFFGIRPPIRLEMTFLSAIDLQGLNAYAVASADPVTIHVSSSSLLLHSIRLRFGADSVGRLLGLAGGRSVSGLPGPAGGVSVGGLPGLAGCGTVSVAAV